MRNKQSLRSSRKGGLPPGTLMHVGARKVKDVEISIFDFDETVKDERRAVTVDDCIPYLKSSTITWIDVVGLHDIDLLKRIAEKFDIHPLVMEDVLNTEQRPKVQELESYLFIVMKMNRPSEAGFEVEQISVILKDHCVITFQEDRGDVFDAIRERIRSDRGRIRRSGADYLLYALIDAIVDGYFPHLELLSESLAGTEEQILNAQDIGSLQDLHARRRELMGIRKSIWPTREIVSFLERETPQIDDATQIYLKDLLDHVMQIIDTVESLRDVVSGLLELYMSTSSFKSNEVMKVLTIIATIFIPLTFVAGVYGMNFRYMPELATKVGYPIVLLAMAGMAVGMVIFFKRKKWF